VNPFVAHASGADESMSLVMLFADQTSIREVILFPHLRPETPSP